MTVVIQRAKRHYVFLLFLFLYSTAQAATFVYTESMLQAQRLISVLKLEPARQILVLEKQRHPENTAIDYLENYLDFYTLISSQNVDVLKRLLPNKTKRIKRLSELPDNNPMKRYAQAELEIQWAFSHSLHHEFVSSARAFRSAYKLLESNMQLFPHFALNTKSMGMLKAVIGTIPDNYKWIAGITGMNGTFTEGMRMLSTFITSEQHQNNNLLEMQCAMYYYTFLQLNFGDKNLCWQYCEKHTADYSTNLLSTYLRSYTALKTGRSLVAIQVLQQRPIGKEYIEFPMLHYLEGVAMLNMLHPEAPQYLKKYVSFSKGKNYIKDSYRRLAWHYLLQNDLSQYQQYKQMATTYGEEVADEDKSAQRECSEESIPDTVLLKARLLFDGGNYGPGLELLARHPISQFTHAEQINEYYYRLARLYHESNSWRMAIVNYERAIETGAKLNTYFAPMSCLQLALIYEKLNLRDKALYYFEKARTYRNYDYRSGITQKANAGISRMKH